MASRRFRIDLAYPELKIALEIDGDEPHFGARKTDADNTRDGLLQLGGWLTQHFTRRHIRHEQTRQRGARLASDQDAFSWRRVVRGTSQRQETG